jgi:acetyl-CoA acyltransferase 1
MVIDTLGLDTAKVNPKGGAIALGFVLLRFGAFVRELTFVFLRHPLGATGGRLLSSLIYELRRTDKKVGVATLCMGTGAGKATLIGEYSTPRSGVRRELTRPYRTVAE